MTGSWLPTNGSERLHHVRSWNEDLLRRSARLVPTPVPYLTDREEPGIHVSLLDGANFDEFAEYSVGSASELPPEIAEIIFGAHAS